ncbi:hypothetical protein KM043_002812 [Ampulex compressa]|nr:hypothetical protein KM043_002812 [Ampulex compressa]
MGSFHFEKDAKALSRYSQSRSIKRVSPFESTSGVPLISPSPRTVRLAALCPPTPDMKYFDVKAQQVVSPSWRCGVSRFKPHTVTQALSARCVAHNSN